MQHGCRAVLARLAPVMRALEMWRLPQVALEWTLLLLACKLASAYKACISPQP